MSITYLPACICVLVSLRCKRNRSASRCGPLFWPGWFRSMVHGPCYHCTLSGTRGRVLICLRAPKKTPSHKANVEQALPWCAHGTQRGRSCTVRILVRPLKWVRKRLFWRQQHLVGAKLTQDRGCGLLFTHTIYVWIFQNWGGQGAQCTLTCYIFMYKYNVWCGGVFIPVVEVSSGFITQHLILRNWGA